MSANVCRVYNIQEVQFFFFQLNPQEFKIIELKRCIDFWHKFDSWRVEMSAGPIHSKIFSQDLGLYACPVTTQMGPIDRLHPESEAGMSHDVHPPNSILHMDSVSPKSTFSVFAWHQCSFPKGFFQSWNICSLPIFLISNGNACAQRPPSLKQPNWWCYPGLRIPPTFFSVRISTNGLFSLLMAECAYWPQSGL